MDKIFWKKSYYAQCTKTVNLQKKYSKLKRMYDQKVDYIQWVQNLYQGSVSQAMSDESRRQVAKRRQEGNSWW